jgi:alcohol dehydrogenase (NADP+)
LAAGFELSREDMEKIGTLDKKMGFNDPSDYYRWRLYADLEGMIVFH